jgi:nucleoside-diphosphate-sugar epimerase
MSERRVLVAGCGFLGASIARLLAAEGWAVTGCTHSPESAAALAGEPFRVVAGDFTRREELSGWGEFDAVIHAASSRRGGPEEYRRIYVEGMQALLDAFSPRQAIFVSSTSVYAQTDGGWVTEASPAEPQRETGRHLLEAENLALGAGGAAVRLAGLYGPGRSVLLKKFFHGEARIEARGERWLNQIHRDDAASAVATLLRCGVRGVFNVADDHPLLQRDLYHGLAERFHRPLPPDGPIDLNRKRGWTHKRVSNARLRSLGWAPHYPSFFDALERDPALVSMALVEEPPSA